MKTRHKIMLTVFVLFAFGLPMVMKGSNGKPIMTLDDWMPNKNTFDKSLSKIQSLGERVSNIGDNEPSGRPVLATVDSPTVLSSSSGKMYKWQDAKGRWHFSSEKPQVESEVSVEALPEVKNLLPAPIARRGSSSTIASPSSSPLLGGLPAGGLSISMDQAGQLLKNVEKITKDAEQRKALMDQ
ncbi:MAG: hypothetical protein ACI92E_002491 [Oceanicoccus sp.]|jgi:hypothetical protein